MNKLFPVLWAAVAISLSSCWHPPFDPLVSASEFTVDKLGAPVWSRTVTLKGDAAGGYYLPSRDPAYYGTTGIWIKKTDDYIRAGVFSPSTSTGLSLTFSTYNEFGDSAVILSPLNSIASKVLIGANSNIDNGGIVTYNGTSSPVYNPAIITDVVGFGAVPYDGVTDSLAIMTWPTGEAHPSIRSVVLFNNSSPSFSPTPWPLSLDPPPRPTGTVYAAYYESGSYLYSSYPVDDSMVTYRWNYDGGSTPVTSPILLPIARKLTGVLSDGRLLANEEDKLFVYSADGTDSFSIPTGILRFVHEYTPDYINWVSVFTRTVQIPGGKNDDGSEYLIEIYEIPTANLRDLSD